MAKTKHMIWSNIGLDLAAWRTDLLATETGLTEDELYARMISLNDEHLEDERISLNIDLGKPILVIADLGLWNGRKPGYKFVQSGNIRDCLYDNADYCEWYVDGYGNMRGTAHHHDGTNYYLYRVVKDNISDERLNALLEDIMNGKATPTKIGVLTESIGPAVAAVHGWELRRHQTKACAA